MRVSNWNPQRYDSEFLGVAMKRLKEAAEVVATNARAKVPVGTLSRPIYKTGPYAGQTWTGRDAGALKKTIRVRTKHGTNSDIVGEHRNVRIYAGNFNVYYAKIVEYAGKKFMRNALRAAKPTIRSILGAK